jgi:hypothetical protein
MQYISASAKSVTAVGLILIGPVVLLFAPSLVIGFASDIIDGIGSVPVVLSLSGVVTLFALYKLRRSTPWKSRSLGAAPVSAVRAATSV